MFRFKPVLRAGAVAVLTLKLTPCSTAARPSHYSPASHILLPLSHPPTHTHPSTYTLLYRQLHQYPVYDTGDDDDPCSTCVGRVSCLELVSLHPLFMFITPDLGIRRRLHQASSKTAYLPLPQPRSSCWGSQCLVTQHTPPTPTHSASIIPLQTSPAVLKSYLISSRFLYTISFFPSLSF